MTSSVESSIHAVLKRYADAWVANDLRAIVDSYHDEVVFHYFGRSPLRARIAERLPAWQS